MAARDDARAFLDALLQMAQAVKIGLVTAVDSIAGAAGVAANCSTLL